MPLPTLLQHLRGKPSEEHVRQVVQSDEKGRFVLDDACAPPRIRAAQGHSVALEDPILTPVLTAASAPPLALHVTSEKGWSEIQASGELRRMARTHVHFATAPHMARANAWATVLLRLDVEATLAAGLQLWLSDNGVLLCEGPVPVGLVSRMEAEELPEEWQEAQQQGAHPRRQRKKGGPQGGGGGSEGGHATGGEGPGEGTQGEGAAGGEAAAAAATGDPR